MELCEADALKPETLDDVLSGVDTAYYLVHSMASGKKFLQAMRRRRAISQWRQAARGSGASVFSAA